jgi:hypothetical protein
MTFASTPTAAAARQRKHLTYQNLLDAVFAVLIFAGCVSFIEPSPYDFVALIAIPLWLVGGFKIRSVQLVILVLWVIYTLCGFTALIPYWNQPGAPGEPSPLTYQIQSLYLICTTCCFTLYFGEYTLHRAHLCIKAFTIGALLSALVSILSYFDIAGLGVSLITVEGRVSGTFKDPNVFGTYLILGTTYLFQYLLIAKTKWRLTLIFPLALLLVGTFISYSRGSWGSTIVSLTLLTFATFVTVRDRATKRRIVLTTFFFVVLAVLLFAIILSQEKIREFFLWRISAHEYDEGPTGRFGNQQHAIPMLANLPWGFGPLRFRDYFGLEPHNSYIGAFANDGWLGGLTWIVIVVMTNFVGFRLMFARSPVQRISQVVWPTLFVGLVQGFQIDIDHWRQIFLFFGMIWGFEAARQRYRDRERMAIIASGHPQPRVIDD